MDHHPGLSLRAFTGHRCPQQPEFGWSRGTSAGLGSVLVGMSHVPVILLGLATTQEVFLWKRVKPTSQHISWAFLVAQLVKNMPAMQKTTVQFLGGKDSLEKG